MPPGLPSADERYHPVGAEGSWGESWYFDFATPDGALGGYVRIGVLPNRGACWYWACLVGEGRRLVTVVDHEVRPPRRPSLEIRHHGLWADHTIEVPFDHATLGCEAFALALDDPAEMYGPGPQRGDLVPFGLDLEWDTAGPVHIEGAGRYEMPCRVHGEVLVGDERIDLDAVGVRSHAWGPDDRWSTPWARWSACLEDGTRLRGTGADARPGGHGFPETATAATAATATGEGPVLDIEPVAFAPVLVTASDGRSSRLARALCRYRDRSTGRRGAGWAEWNQPHA